MKRLFFAVFFTACMLWHPEGQARQHSFEHTEVSLLTAVPGEELYAAFGHSAIRLKDTVSGYDAVFNYGMFDFNAPNFYGNFARGKMDYCLGVQSFEGFIAAYREENRAIREQVFVLDSLQKDFIIRFLFRNAQPENRYYRYHFFLDNCATRIRDLVNETYRGLVLPEATGNPTYRELIYLYLTEQPWGRFVIDIALGMPTDRKTDMSEQMFLPDYLSDALALARYNGQPVVRETRDVLTPEYPLVVRPGAITPMMVCCLILALAVLFFFVRKAAKVFDTVFFFVAGLVGVLVIFLWFFTDHTNTQQNLNIFWALPFHAVMAFFLLPAKRKKFVRKYFLATAVIAVLLLSCWAFLPQKMNEALIPVVIAIALRAYQNSKP
jgi:hypothetical protein